MSASTLLAGLGRSPLLSDVGPQDRNILRLIGTVLLGGVAAGLAAAVVLVLIGVVITVNVVASGGDPQVLIAQVQDLLSGRTSPNLSQALGILVVLALANTAMFGAFVAVAAALQKRPLRRFITAAPKFRWRLMLAGLLLFVLIVGPVIGAEVVLSDEKPAMPLFTLADTLGERSLYVIVAVIGLLMAAWVEEFLCRGWLLRETAAWTRNFWILGIVNGVLFSALHYPDTDPNAFIGRAIMAVGFCYMALRTGGIEFATGAHAANNILLILFVQTPPVVPAPPEPLSPLTNVGTLAGVAGYVLITEIVVRWTPLRRWTRAELDPEPEAARAF